MRLHVKHLHRIRRKGKVYAYHRKTGERLDIDGNGNARTPEQIAARCIEINAQTARKPKPQTGTLADLVTTYKSSVQFTRLAEKTRYDYRRILDWLSEHYGDTMVADITTEDILGLQDELSDRPRTADAHCAMMQTLLNYAIKRRSRYGGITFNVASRAAGVERLHRTDGYDPWPEPLVEQVLKTAPAEVCWLIDMARFTGQRASDLARMRWSDIENGCIRVKQQKTGAELMVPIHPTLAKTLKKVKRRSVFILTNQQGKPWRVDAMSKAIAKVRPEGTAFVLHGFRKNATINLLECGCTTEEVKAITMHSTDDMVRHYGRKVNQVRLAGAAMRKWAGDQNDG